MNFLKKIRIVGFKSFADETIIDTGPGITAIVGPNGCGKSNILDAVRWVLGERSAKGLRAKSMDDVIFLGSETRNSGGFAEVEIYFNNEQRVLDLDQDEVSIGRRVYVNSGSEYLLNGKRVPRKEIERVLMDTGIGKSAYSIMEQGRMSEILKASPEDRRALFDEAAGVSRFKAEREETLERLSATEQNLLRLDDILKGKREEIEHLERQAKKTRQYLKLKELLDKSDKKLRYIQYRDLVERRDAGRTKLDELQQKRETLSAAIAEKEAKSEELARITEAESEEMHRLDRDYHQSLARNESLIQNRDRIAEELKSRAQKLEVLVSRKNAEEKSRISVEKKLEASTQMELDLGQEIDSLRDQSKKIETEVQKREAEIRACVEQEERNQEELREIEQTQERLLTQMRQVTDELVLELEAKHKDLEQHETKRRSIRENFEGEIARIKQLLSALGDHLSSGAAASARENLREIRVDDLARLFSESEALDERLRSVLFGKTGLLARKEELDREMESSRKRRDELQKQNGSLFEKRKADLTENEKAKNRRIEIDLDIAASEERRKSSSAGRESTGAQLDEIRERIAFLNGEIEEAKAAEKTLREQEQAILAEMKSIEKSSGTQKSAMEAMQKKIEKKHRDLAEIKERFRKDREQLDRVLPAIGEQERLVEHIADDIQELVENLYNDFQTDVADIEKEFAGDSSRFKEQESEFKRIRQEISALGQFNALAIEELERSSEAYNMLMEQRKDIENARDNILEVLKETDMKSREIFLDNFTRIQNNFQEVFT